MENVIDAGVHLANENILEIEDLPEYIKRDSGKNKKKTLKEIIEETEKKEIEKMLMNCKFDKNMAAEALGISNSTIYEKIKKYNII
ncbi:hypothetical protein OR571_15045 [Psychrobacillus sp. NEAU-3TGS]|uniref:helix-turn-helix domain-containing protein n=1 Tax=Psychrobacillus sp. NEAU-3TGS TaxID=2995412 RepID=UPI002497A4E9|nr:hypothetical protein [Psychrobacillus sp. NEAU-3TGS]